MVTVGYGDISPETDLERLFSIFTVLSACCVFAYSISEVYFIHFNVSSLIFNMICFKVGSIF